MSTRFAVISDIHGNLEGFQAVLRDIKKRRVSEILCLGDVIGYGADPEACWALARKSCNCILKGNHEAILLGDIDESGCSALGKQSAAWTRAHVTDRTSVALSKLPTHFEQYGAVFFHSAPEGPEMWTYLNQTEQVTDAFRGCASPLIFYGHTHRPRVTLIGPDGAVNYDLLVQRTVHFTVRLDQFRCYVNPGSAGQQRDSHTDVSYVVCELDGTTAKISIYRIPYKRFFSYQKVKRQGCGTEAADYLIREKWRRDWFEFINHWK